MPGIVSASVGSIGATAIAVIAWCALSLQLWLLVRDAPDWVAPTIRFFSFFTILTNTLVAIVLTGPLVLPRAATWLAGARVRTATAVYMAVVGIVYGLVLEQLWNPQGLQAVADTLLHKVVPLAYVLFWFVCVEKGSLRQRDVPWWLVYPLMYLMYSLVRGAATGWYPYPFIDAVDIGYPRVFINTVVLILAFFALSGLTVLVDSWMAAMLRRRANRAF